MKRLFPLQNTIKQYDWGSPWRIPRLLNRENPRWEPWAELWMGAHPGGPSETTLDNQRITLDELIRKDPSHFLGGSLAERYETLPFLLKLLATERPLSLQAHPNKEQARLGWERENAEGIPLEDPARLYRDANHKPELLCALSHFQLLCGFRNPWAFNRILDTLLPNAPEPVSKSLLRLRDPQDERSRAAILLTPPEDARKILGEYIIARAEDPAIQRGTFASEWYLAARLAQEFPGDPGMLAPFYLNLITLHPGEAIFLPPGTPHTYLEGFGIEIMANSDNTLRGGLTSKKADIPRLLEILDCRPYNPEILSYESSSPALCEDFSLAYWETPGGFHTDGPCIALNIRGELTLSLGSESLTLKTGESAFIAPGGDPGEIRLSGNFAAFIAGVPPAPPRDSAGNAPRPQA